MNKLVWLLFVAQYFIISEKINFFYFVPQLINDGLTKQDIGKISSLHGIAAAIMTFPAGILSDKLPVKYLFTLGIIASGTSSLIFSLSSTYNYYAIAWFIHGLGMTCSFGMIPKLAMLVSDPGQMATSMSVIMTAINAAGIINPVLNSTLFESWRMNMVVYACALMTIGLICLTKLGHGNQTGRVNKKKNDQATVAKDQGIKPALVKNPLLWLCVNSQSLSIMITMILGAWVGLYFTNELNMDPYMSTLFTSMMNFGAVFGRIATAKALDHLVVKAKNKANQNKLPYNLIKARLPVMIGLTLMLTWCMHLISVGLGTESSTWFVALVAIGVGAATAGTMLSVSVCIMEVDPSNAGLCQSIIQFTIIGADIINGLPVSMFAGAYGWQAVFIMAEIMCVLVAGYQIFVLRLFGLNKVKSE